MLVDTVLASLSRYSATDGNGTTLLADISDSVEVQFVRDLPDGVACTSSTDCQNLHCEDGVCCHTACGSSDANDCEKSVAAGAPSNGTCATLTSAQV